MTRTGVKGLGIMGCIVLVLVAGGGIMWAVGRQPEVTPAIRGAALAQELGCFACHGAGGVGGVADPTSPGGTVPDWTYPIANLYITCEHDIRDWILHGVPTSESQRRAITGFEPLVPMPAYENTLSARELDDLVAYFLAVSGWAPEIPKDVYEGRKIAERLGCFGCHGPSGMGGVANPGSFKGHIPPWDGEEYGELVRNEEELREWILEGRIQRLWGNLAARFFLQRQKTPMPAYHDFLSDEDLDKLVTYICWLRTGTHKPTGKGDDATSVIGMIMGVK